MWIKITSVFLGSRKSAPTRKRNDVILPKKEQIIQFCVNMTVWLKNSVLI